MSEYSPFYPGLVLENRYKVQRVLGRGGFGKTYLAENLNRFGELCVLKELAPQIRDPELLKKAAELFRREAQTLYRLSHPQIPEFRELMTVELEGSDYLLMVQQYIEGETYHDLLHEGKPFQPQEITQLLWDLLPVLSYIHGQGVIHRDISPDNLIRDRATGKPMLIDFGGVKQIAVTALQQFSRHVAPTRLEKVGYTPEEQKLGHPTPRSDLYMLGATAVVLLTGKQPFELYDEQERVWNWRSQVRVEPQLASFLDGLLANQASDRFPSAQAALQALEPLMGKAATLMNRPESAILPLPVPQREVEDPHTWTRWRSRLKTLVVAPKAKPLNPDYNPPSTQVVQLPSPALWSFKRPNFRLPVVQWPSFKWPQMPQMPQMPSLSLPAMRPPQVSFPWTGITHTARQSVLMVATGAGFLLLGFWVGPAVVSLIQNAPRNFSLAKQPDPLSCDQFTQQTKPLKTSVLNDVMAQTDRVFHSQHPELQGRPLTRRPEDQVLRQTWCQTGLQVLQQPK